MNRIRAPEEPQMRAVCTKCLLKRLGPVVENQDNFVCDNCTNEGVEQSVGLRGKFS